MDNVYNTSDPQKLLQLKRLEADALLDVLRSINRYDLSIAQLCTVARNMLLAQLGVKKIVFFYEFEQVWREGMRFGFPKLREEAILEILEVRKLSPVQADTMPELTQLQAEYVIPIGQSSELNAYFVIAEFADSEVETQSDLIFIETLGHILSVAIQNKELFQETMAQEFLRRDLEVAETIQKQLLISDFDRFDEVDVFGFNLPHRGIGGDFYDIIKKDDGQFFVCIADVAGKGMGAALLMANLQANLRALCAQYNQLSAIITELNQILYNITVGEKFVTLFLAKIELQAERFTYINAGHNYPILKRQADEIRLDKGCVLLGIMPDLVPEESELSYQAGDVLFMFTDGVVEQLNAHEEMFGSERILNLLNQKPELPAKTLVEALLGELERFSEGIDATDDVTMLSVKFLPQS